MFGQLGQIGPKIRNIFYRNLDGHCFDSKWDIFQMCYRIKLLGLFSYVFLTNRFFASFFILSINPNQINDTHFPVPFPYSRIFYNYSYYYYFYYLMIYENSKVFLSKRYQCALFLMGRVCLMQVVAKTRYAHLRESLCQFGVDEGLFSSVKYYADRTVHVCMQFCTMFHSRRLNVFIKKKSVDIGGVWCLLRLLDSMN